MGAGFPVKRMNGDLVEEIRFYLQNFLFILDMFNLLESDQIMEGQDFHGKMLRGRFVMTQGDKGKCA